MTKSAQQRKIWIISLGLGSLLLFLCFAGLNAFKPAFLDPETSGQILFFGAISAATFLLFIGVLLMLVRNVLKLYADQKSRVMGSRLRTRMLWGAILISLLPIAFMSSFSYLLLNRSVERWFSQPVTQMRDDSNSLALALAQYTSANARVEAESISSALPSLALGKDTSAGLLNREAVQHILRSHEITLQGGFAVVYRDNRAVAALNMPQSAGQATAVKRWLPQSGNAHPSDPESEPIEDLQTEPINPADPGGHSRPQHRAPSRLPPSSPSPAPTMRSASQPPPSPAVSLRTSSSACRCRTACPPPWDACASPPTYYWTLYRGRRRLSQHLHAAPADDDGGCALRLHLARPASVEAGHQAGRKRWPMPWLSSPPATTAIACRSPPRKSSARLVRSFNHMAEDLEGSRAQVEASTALLSAANATLEARRGELETMLETIRMASPPSPRKATSPSPTRALSEMLDPGGPATLHRPQHGRGLPRGSHEAIDRLMRRSHRMGTASAEMEMTVNGSTLNLLVTVRGAEGNIVHSTPAGVRQHLGYVLVLENATELLRAQKQSAWKEVARRVAHEIKNPLTPIALTANRSSATSTGSTTR